MKQALFSIFSKFSLPFLLVFISPALAFAADVTVQPTPVGSFAPLAKVTSADFGSIVGRVVTIAFVLAIVIALGFLVYGGIKWILSGGDKAAVESARNTIVAAVVGLVIVFLSYFILSVVLGFFGLNLNSLVLPTVIVPNS